MFLEKVYDVDKYDVFSIFELKGVRYKVVIVHTRGWGMCVLDFMCLFPHKVPQTHHHYHYHLPMTYSIYNYFTRQRLETEI